MTQIREQLLNTSIESGMRSMIVLNAINPQACDLRRLVTYDYLLVHSADIDGGPKSLHPESPFRGGELIVRREVVKAGLDLVTSKGLLHQFCAPEGIIYQCTELGQNFLTYFESPYFARASKVAKWIGKTFGDVHDEELYALISAKLGVWGTEFVNDPYNELEGQA